MATRVLPTRIDPPLSAMTSQRPPASPRTNPFLLVEDDESVRNLLGTVLREHGYVVLEACDGEDGLRVWGRHSGRFDLLVTDLVMPRLGGRRLAERLREMAPTLPVLMLSGYAEEAFRRNDENASDLHFLPKPFGLKQLAAKVKEVLSGATPH